METEVLVVSTTFVSISQIRPRTETRVGATQAVAVAPIAEGLVGHPIGEIVTGDTAHPQAQRVEDGVGPRDAEIAPVLGAEREDAVDDKETTRAQAPPQAIRIPVGEGAGEEGINRQGRNGTLVPTTAI